MSVTTPNPTIEEINALVGADLSAVDQRIESRLYSDVVLINQLSHYIIGSGGKRLRPILVLLSAKAVGYTGQKHIDVACIIEFIHTATLLHDDVVDISSLRRGRPTANAEFGNAPSVLVGDFLYSRAFQIMVQLGNLDILDHMADTTNTIAEGEVLQLARAGHADTTESQYLDVISRKTAILFAAACYGAATLNGSDLATRQAMHAFGLNLGIAFQMVDDALDYEGDPATMGKNVGDDLTEGKTTLPLIHAMREGTEAEQALIRHAINSKSVERIDDIITAVKRCGSLDYTRSQARHYHDLALAQLQQLPASDARTALERVTHLSIDRDH